MLQMSSLAGRYASHVPGKLPVTLRKLGKVLEKGQIRLKGDAICSMVFLHALRPSLMGLDHGRGRGH